MKKAWKTISRSTRTAKFGLVVMVLWIVVAVLAPVIAPYGINDIDITQRLAPPAWAEGGSIKHVLGTDQLGRDVLTRLIYGSRISLIVGIVAGAVGMVIGVVLGLMAGYFGGVVDSIISRMIDVMLAFPFIFLAMLLVAVLGPSLSNVILVLGITGWVPYARTIRAQVLSVKEKEFVKAANAIGCRDLRIIFKQILPSVVDSAIILGTMDVGSNILAEASLTFLGLGIPPSIATWGNMIANGRDYIFNAGWLTTIPGIALLVGCLSINFVGDWLRDVRDPRLRGVD
jgi:peptide/nickel transport system permease protein